MIAPRHGNYFALAGVTHRPLYTIEGGDDDSVDKKYLRVLLRCNPRGHHHRRDGRFGVVAQIAQIGDSAAARQTECLTLMKGLLSGGRANATWSDDGVSHNSIVLSMGCLGLQTEDVLTQAPEAQYSVIGGNQKKRKSTRGHIILVERQGLRVEVQRLRYDGIGKSHQVVGASIKITASPDDGRPPSTPASAAVRRPDTPDDDDGRPAVEEKTRPPATPASTVKKPGDLVVVERVVAERVVEAAAASSGEAAAEAVGEARPGARPGDGADDGPGAPAVWPEAPQQRGGKKTVVGGSRGTRR